MDIPEQKLSFCDENLNFAKVILSTPTVMNAATMPSARKLPIGIQSFEKLRREGFVYVDKTALVYQLVSHPTPYFLSRPRRFGKSLLLSTLEAYFLGKRELFRGLAIEQMETEWAEHAVLHLSLNAEKYDKRERLVDMLEYQLSGWEEKYGTSGRGTTHSSRFMEVIKAAHGQTGRGVVVLIDEYDKPLLRSFYDSKLQDDFRETLTAFYTVLKDADPWLQFVFITGVTKFAQLGVFSNLNQLNDISLDGNYAKICGMTGEEIQADFVPELQRLAEVNELTYSETIAELTRMYDGYHFSTDNMVGMYNPFSVLNALSKSSFRSYWFASGTPTFLAEMLRKTDYDLRDLDGVEMTEFGLADYRVDMSDPVPMIFQSGYLTIKSYDERFRIFTLGFPNEEVRYGFLNFMSAYYTPVPGERTSFYIGKFTQELESGDTEAFLTRMRAFFADFPYELNDRTERHYQVVFYLIFKLLGQFTEAEVHSAAGRADAVVKTRDYIHVFEFKLNGTAEQALEQIDRQGYLIPYTADARQLVKVGVEFSSETRNLSRWLKV